MKPDIVQNILNNIHKIDNLCANIITKYIFSTILQYYSNGDIKCKTLYIYNKKYKEFCYDPDHKLILVNYYSNNHLIKSFFIIDKLKTTYKTIRKDDKIIKIQSTFKDNKKVYEKIITVHTTFKQIILKTPTHTIYETFKNGKQFHFKKITNNNIIIEKKWNNSGKLSYIKSPHICMSFT